MQTTIFLLLLFLSNSQSAKILGVFPVTAPSHNILSSSLMKALAEKGHDVTIITPFVEKNLPKNGTYKQIILTGFLEQAEEQRKEMNMLKFQDINLFIMLPFFIPRMIEMTEATLNHTNVQKLLQSNESFDAVIVEEFNNEAHKGFAAHFNAPLILLSTIGANPWINIPVGNPTFPSYIPNIFLSYSTNMTFFERTVNTIFHIYVTFLSYFLIFPQKIYYKYFPNNPPFYDVFYNTSIALLNSHPSTNQPVPYVPNMIDIGGYHINPPKKLPQDLQNFLDEAENGVIYFSMGSNIRSSDLPDEKRQAFLETFANLKMKVLWKWEKDTMSDKPDNVKLGKWLPQQDILAHPNVKLFITHGGLLSTTETVYHGVPVLAIPIMADQKLNAQKIVNAGFGRQINYNDISKEILLENIQELLGNPKYKENAKKRSVLFHDRLVKPIDTAIYWIEYVIRNNGATHLKVEGINFPWYKYMLVDVITFILIASFLVLFVILKILKTLIFKSKPKKFKKL